jgi:hypothetical protein
MSVEDVKDASAARQFKTLLQRVVPAVGSGPGRRREEDFAATIREYWRRRGFRVAVRNIDLSTPNGVSRQC